MIIKMKTIETNQRAYALDALRGYAIITMVLSATIASGILPPWMYHAQTPPPAHIYNSAIAGLTWVDLVFPFFLFAMGAAFPFSIGKKIEKGDNQIRLVWDAILRGLQLTFFAIFIQHFYPYILSSPQDGRSWGLALLSFALLFPMFMRIPLKMPVWAHSTIKLLAYVAAFLLMATVHYAEGRTWNLDFSNIIILLLANMAIFGSIVYMFTKKNRWARIAILICLMAVLMSSGVEGSWAQTVFNFSPLPWMYKFTYLKYLFIVIPGSFAGEYLIDWMKRRNMEVDVKFKNDRKLSVLFLGLTIAIILTNLYFLYCRLLVANLFSTFLLLGIGCFFLRKGDGFNQKLWKNLFYSGAYLLLLGLFFESYGGGIKKDPPTYSYYFVTSGLAFMALLAFNIICDFYGCVRSTKFLVMSGQNPMIAYVAGDLLIMPILGLLGITPLLDYFNLNVGIGFFRGVILTTIAVLVTMFFTRIKCFWRT
jgi:predicted acyltransferase